MVIIAMVVVTWLETGGVTKFNVAQKYFWSFGFRLVLPLLFLIVSKFNVTQSISSTLTAAFTRVISRVTKIIVSKS